VGNASPVRLRRSELAVRTIEALNRGNWANPDVLLVECSDGRRVVVKDYKPRSALVRWTYGRFITRREARAYRLLEGSPAVPTLLGEVDALALVIEYRPGTRMSRDLAGKLPATFMGELRNAVSSMHARGVIHLDLRHRSNVLADASGHPVLIDFASAVFFKPSGIWFRWLGPSLAKVDWGAVRKWEVRVAPATAKPGSSS